MNMVGRVGSLLTQGVYSVATPFHPFGGAVDIIVVEQPDGTYRSTPWYVRFGKFQGILKRSEKIVRISVNGFEANFNMFLDNSGEAYFLREVFPGNEDIDFGSFGRDDIENVSGDGRKGEVDESKNVQEYEEAKYSEYIDELENIVMSSEELNSDMLQITVDGHVIMAPISKDDDKIDDAQLNIPRFHLGPTEGANEDFETDIDVWSNSLYPEEKDGIKIEDQKPDNENQNGNGDMNKGMLKDRDMFKSCLELTEICASSNGFVEGEQATSSNLATENIDHATRSDIPLDTVGQAVDIDIDIKDCGNTANENSVNDISINGDVHDVSISDETEDTNLNDMPAESNDVKVKCTEEPPTVPSVQIFPGFGFEISKCSQLFSPGMGSTTAKEIFEAHQIFEDEFKAFGSEVVKNANLIVRYKNEYFLWEKVARIIVGKALFGSNFMVEPSDSIPIEHIGMPTPSTSSTKWRLWPIPFRRVKSFQRSNSSFSNDEFFDSESFFEEETQPSSSKNSPRKIFQRTNMPTTDQIASLNLREGQNTITFNFTTRVLGKQQVDAHIYLWKWNAKIVISDVDGTITRSDVLGQFMPLVGRDWSQSGVARLFTAIKENGYQLLFLSARAIVQAYLTKSFLSNLKQDGNALPTGPVVISPDGLFPALYREVIRRAPHEFKIACLQDIRALFPSDHNPFYAGFGNRDTDELSYTKIGIPKGKIFIINPKGEVALNNCSNKKSYTSLHTLVDDMFPPTSNDEQEAYNSWNYWKIPLPNID